MIDGFATRLFDEDKVPAGTRVFLSSMGIIPEMITNNDTNPGTVHDALFAPLLDLTIAADGKTAHAALWHHSVVKKAEIKDGLTIESNDGKRVRGRLKTDIKDLMALDLYFDVATVSVCHQNGSDCGED